MTDRQPTLKQAQEAIDNMMRHINGAKEWKEGRRFHWKTGLAQDGVFTRWKGSRGFQFTPYPSSDVSEKCFFCRCIIIDKRDALGRYDSPTCICKAAHIRGWSLGKNCECGSREFVSQGGHCCTSCRNKRASVWRFNREWNELRLSINQARKALHEQNKNSRSIADVSSGSNGRSEGGETNA